MYDLRYSVSKSFDECVASRVILKEGTPISTNIQRIYVQAEEPISSASNCQLYERVPLLKMIGTSMDGSSVIPLSQQFDFKVGTSFNTNKNNKEALKYATKGTTFWEILEDSDVENELIEEAVARFPGINPLTNEPDIDRTAYYTKFIPLVVNSGLIPPQKSLDGTEYFNPNGVVSVAEFFYMLNSIKYGSSGYENGKTSVDGVVTNKDYFSEGYNSIVNSPASPLYHLYTRKELTEAITRAELAYITVVGWRDFRGRKKLHGGRFSTGLRVNWDTPARYIGKFKDGKNLKVSKKVVDIVDLSENDSDLQEIDLKSWFNPLGIKFKAYLENVKQGRSALPLPMLMSMIELDVLDLFYYEGSTLSPLRQVSRGEMTYFLTKLAKTFPMEFKSSGDNSYM